MSAELLSRVSIPFDSVDLTLTGDLEFDDENHTLVLWTDEGVEVLSTCLRGHGLEPRPGAVWIKNWSEHKGLAVRLVELGLISLVRIVYVGPFASPAYEVLVRR